MGWVMKLDQQRKSILAAGKLVLFDVKTLRLFFSSREFFFSSIWTAKTSLRSVLTTVRSRKRKILSRKRNFAFEFFHLRATSFQPLGTIIPRQAWKVSLRFFHIPGPLTFQPYRFIFSICGASTYHRSSMPCHYMHTINST